MAKIWRLYGDGRDLHLAVEAKNPAEGKDKALSLFPRFFFQGIKTLELRRDRAVEERRPYDLYRRKHLGEKEVNSNATNDQHLRHARSDLD